MMEKNNVELKVCKECDAPLPFLPKSISYFTYDKFVCDDCLKFLDKNENKRR